MTLSAAVSPSTRTFPRFLAGDCTVDIAFTGAARGAQSWIKDPELDAWYAQQAKERGLHASGPRVAVSGVGLISLFAFSGPYEDVQLKSCCQGYSNLPGNAVFPRLSGDSGFFVVTCLRLRSTGMDAIPWRVGIYGLWQA